MLMDDYAKYLVAGKKIKHHDFEGEVYKIFPGRNHDYYFAEDIVSCLNK